ncbi:uncharacterized protein LOC110094561, partial [Dendrobium catenatum]|uniref:uncharacterized protein LOC110094561 n=1 Tax=Dendrobium catenatum TaxID=906689 RepID=UPI0010A047F1
FCADAECRPETNQNAPHHPFARLGTADVAASNSPPDVESCVRPPRRIISPILHFISFIILIYCRSSILPQHQWPVNQKVFTLDVLYLHDKPGPENCPQKVYDVLVDALEHVSEYEGYIFESGQGLSRVLFRQICILLSHPQQRCAQDDLDIPKSLEKRLPPATDATIAEESISSTIQ